MAKTVDEKPSITLPGTVEKIIPSIGPAPEKAEISEGAEPLYPGCGMSRSESLSPETGGFFARRAWPSCALVRDQMAVRIINIPKSSLQRYLPGAVLRVRLYGGREVEASFVKAIFSTRGFRLQVDFDGGPAEIDAAQITGMYQYCLLGSPRKSWRYSIP